MTTGPRIRGRIFHKTYHIKPLPDQWVVYDQWVSALVAAESGFYATCALDIGLVTFLFSGELSMEEGNLPKCQTGKATDMPCVKN